MSIDIDVLVLPAFDDLAGLPGEAAPWREAYDLERTIRIEGVSNPLRYTEDGLAVVPTGVGKMAAATTTTALLTSDELELDDALVLSVGAAGGPPGLPIGTVVVADSIVDWDDKCRLDPTDDGRFPLRPNPYTEGQGAFELDSELVETARSLGRDVELASRGGEPDSEDTTTEPEVLGGTNLCGDEFWHGKVLAEQASWLVEEHGMEPYRATEMEDSGTAAALERFGRLDRYLSIRGITNYDRPTGDESPDEYLFDQPFESGFGVGIENAVAVARAVADEELR